MGMSNNNPQSNQLSWDVDVDDDSGCEDDDGYLTSLVRNSYLGYLHRCLKKNFEECSPQCLSNSIQNEEDSSELISFYARKLEKKALRSCMRVGVYQRCMVRLMEEIKHTTQQAVLHSIFASEDISFSDRTCTKDTQTTDLPELFEKNVLFSCLNVSSPKVRDKNGIDSYEELLNILMSPSQPSNLNPPAEITVNNNDFLGPRRSNNLDERLRNLGLLSDGEPLVQPVPAPLEPPIAPIKMKPVQLPSDWALELAAQTYNLRQILAKMSPATRSRVELRFRDLFGLDGSSFANSYEFSTCRKRIAGFVVGCLTPYYAQGNIASREVFKGLARKLTEHLLAKSLAPDPTEIKKMIDHIFKVKPQMCNMKEVNSCCIP